MQRTYLKSKIHRATVTGANLNYEGSVTVDRELLEKADIQEYEQVQIYDVTSGSRLTTYAMAGEPGGGEIRINGAAAHLVRTGDIIIVASYASYTEPEARSFKPRIVRVNEKNQIVEEVLVGAAPGKESPGASWREEGERSAASS
jgi:aspartate 1-decarboxylase